MPQQAGTVDPTGFPLRVDRPRLHSSIDRVPCSGTRSPGLLWPMSARHVPRLDLGTSWFGRTCPPPAGIRRRCSVGRMNTRACPGAGALVQRCAHVRRVPGRVGVSDRACSADAVPARAALAVTATIPADCDELLHVDCSLPHPCGGYPVGRLAAGHPWRGCPPSSSLCAGGSAPPGRRPSRRTARRTRPSGRARAAPWSSAPPSGQRTSWDASSQLAGIIRRTGFARTHMTTNTGRKNAPRHRIAHADAPSLRRPLSLHEVDDHRHPGRCPRAPAILLVPRARGLDVCLRRLDLGLRIPRALRRMVLGLRRGRRVDMCCSPGCPACALSWPTRATLAVASARDRRAPAQALFSLGTDTYPRP